MIKSNPARIRNQGLFRDNAILLPNIDKKTIIKALAVIIIIRNRFASKSDKPSAIFTKALGVNGIIIKRNKIFPLI